MLTVFGYWCFLQTVPGQCCIPAYYGRLMLSSYKLCQGSVVFLQIVPGQCCLTADCARSMMPSFSLQGQCCPLPDCARSVLSSYGMCRVTVVFLQTVPGKSCLPADCARSVLSSCSPAGLFNEFHAKLILVLTNRKGSGCSLPLGWIQEIVRMYPVLLTHGLFLT
jgi:hypothetical protein